MKQNKKYSDQFKIAVTILLFTLIVTAILRFVDIANKQLLNHDEAISYLAATCHQGSYVSAVKTLAGTWVTAYEWKKLLYPENFFCFQQIAQDLAYYDIHPPLYFWLLHIWSFIFGTHLWTGPSLNVIIALIITVTLFKFAYYLLADYMAAALVTFTWALNPWVIIISSEARHYDLLALFTLLFVWQIIKATDLSRPFKAIPLVIFTAVGFLTHYHFILVIAGGVIFSIVSLFKKDIRRIVAVFISIATGIAIFMLLHPKFYISFQKQQNPNSSFSYEELTTRLVNIIWILSPFFYIFGILAVLLISSLFIYLKNPSQLTRQIHRTDFSGGYIFFFLFWLAGSSFFLYLALISPAHAMNHPRYLSIVWIFIAFVPVFILRFSQRYREYLTVFFYILPLLIALITPLKYLFQPNMYNVNSKLSTTTNFNKVVIDNLARGVLPTVLWHIPDNKVVFAASQDYLANHPDKWLSQLADNDIYISRIAYDSTVDGLFTNIELLCKKHKRVVRRADILGLGVVLEVQEKKGQDKTVDVVCPD